MIILTTNLGQGEPWSNGNEEVLHFLQSFRTGSSQSDTKWGMSYSSANMQSVYSTTPADWAVV